MRRKLTNRERGNRRDGGKILVLVALCLTMLLGVVACALDIGWIVMARTQLQAGSDASSLAAGTELMPGLGTFAYKTPSEVSTAGSAQAVTFAAMHHVADVANMYVSAGRDVRFGTAKMASGSWVFDWGATPYNAVQVTTRRSVSNSTSGDGMLPLIVAPVLGQSFASVEAFSAAVILPSKGIYIPPGSDINSALSPFAYKIQDYEKFKRAQEHYKNVLGGNPALINPTIMDSAESPPTPLYYKQAAVGNSLQQVFTDSYSVLDPEGDDAANVQTSSDGILELNVYPTNVLAAGNLGTVDVGDPNNSTNDLKRQIVEGPNEADLSYFPDNTIDLSSPFQLNGDTGLSGGIESSIEQIIGQRRAFLLYDQVSDPGNNAMFTVVGMFGGRVMNVKLSGNNKVLVIQPASVQDPGGLPDFEDDDGSDNTVFTPLILAQ
jgi:Flp pilus assembly protein TadG